MTTPRVLVVAGTRPELQKLAPVILALRAADIPTVFLWTGQHTDTSMTTGFAEGLGWPEPDGVLTWNPIQPEMARAVRTWWAIRYPDPPAMVLVQGDTNSGVVGLHAAMLGSGVKVAHLEAGLRSWEADLPEERNRRIIDREADLLLCPSPLAAAHAKVDAKPKARIVVTGQTGLDTLVAAVRLAGNLYPKGVTELIAAIDNVKLPGKVGRWVEPWALLTLHRAALADDPIALGNVLFGAVRAAKKSGLQLVWPVHPRVRFQDSQAAWKGVLDSFLGWGGVVVEPLPYAAMAGILGREETRPDVVITDSGGLVEEACYLGIPTVIVRPSTERWELVAEGYADLVRPENAADHLAEAVARMIPMGRPGGGTPYGCPLLTNTPTSRVVAAIQDALKGVP